MTAIEPENIVLSPDGYTVDHWNYRRRCNDVELALAVTLQRIQEWDRDSDPHGWWHERPLLIALYNEVTRLRSLEESGG